MARLYADSPAGPYTDAALGRALFRPGNQRQQPAPNTGSVSSAGFLMPRAPAFPDAAPLIQVNISRI